MESQISDFEEKRLIAYFAHVAAVVGRVDDVKLICVAHMVHNTTVFLPALADVAPVALALPKPKTSKNPEARVLRSKKISTHPLSRAWAKDPQAVSELIEKRAGKRARIVILDIGGYFAESLSEISSLLRGRLLGVMEGTENGVDKYESIIRECGPYPVPVVTVARSPLKLPEDYHVGSGVVFSVEAVLREEAQILQTRSACVVGYGRVGRSVAEVLRGRGIPTVVHDKYPIPMAEAAARGFRVYRRLDDALQSSNLIISATGKRAITRRALASMRSGTIVATVTSSDDEFESEVFDLFSEPTKVSPSIMRYDLDGQKYIWLVNNGNAANFLHGAVIGPAMQLIEGEKMAAIRSIVDGSYVSEGLVARVPDEAREAVASVWNEHFLDD